MSKLKLVLHRSLQRRKLGYWESPGIMFSGTKSDETVALDKSFASLVEIHDRLAATLNPEWVELTNRFDALVDQMNTLATTEVANNPKARDDHRLLIEAQEKIAVQLEKDVGLEVERLRLLTLEAQQLDLGRARLEEARLREEVERDRLAEEVRQAEEDRIAEIERARLAELGQQAEIERASWEKERLPAKELRAKLEGVATKLIATLSKLNSPDFASWPDSKGLKERLAEYRSSLKTSLTKSHREIAREKVEISEKMDDALAWANEQTLTLNALLASKTESMQALQDEIDKASKVAARGDMEDKSEVDAEVTALKDAADQAFPLLKLDIVARRIETFTESLQGIADQINEKFTNRSRTLAGIQKTEYARVHGESSRDEKSALEAVLGRVTTALKSGTLIEVDKEIETLRSEIESTDSFNQDNKKAKAAFPGIEKLYESIKRINPDDLAEKSNTKVLATLHELLDDVWGKLSTAIDENDWSTASGYILETRFSGMLSQANALVKRDGDAAEVMAEAERQAEILRQQAVAAANLDAQRLAIAAAAQRQADLQAGIVEGDRLFLNHSDEIIKRVWRETKKHAPSTENCGIGGTYSYTDIVSAIKVWKGRVDAGLFDSIHVPGGGGGKIQDKREKNPSRNEIQANFISDWGGNTIDVHVNLRPSDWYIFRS
jgi:hypothetical protein